MSASKDYWKECIQESADTCGLTLTTEQLDCLTESIEIAHENYGMAFYSPPTSDRIGEIEREKQEALKRQRQDMDQQIHHAEKSIKRALRLRDEDHISIGENGEVFLIDGKTIQVQ